MAGELQLALLGKLQISRDGVPLAGFDSNKARALLCYLAVTGRPHLRQALIGLLWGDMPETEAKANLRVVLANLRRLVGSHLVITREMVAFKRDEPYWLDVELFQTILRSTSTELDFEAWREAVEVYKGDFLEGFYVSRAADFEEWVLGQRERLRELALQALHTLAVHHTDRGEYAAGIDYTTRLLALDPWREEAHRQLMLLLARSGQRRAALAQYETCRRILAEELGAEPVAETVALYERLRAAESAPPHNLPAQPTPFIGREEELAELAGLLANPNCRLLTLVGPGGVGKTRLALQAAAQKVETFLHGVYFVSLTPVSSAELLVPTIANVLNFSFYSPEDPKTQLLNYLREKEMLLVLDEFEHLVAGVGLLVDILQSAPGVKILVTSRECLNLRWEWLFDVEGLPFPTSPVASSLPGKGLENYSAVQLFLQCARRMQQRFSLSDETKAGVVRICQLVEGMPLGLELAAAGVRDHTCTAIAQEIERNLESLATSMRDVPERHSSLRAVFEHSWCLLSAEEQHVFRRLSVFRGGFTAEAAEHVAGASTLVLATLVAKSLLRQDASGRYDLHNLLRQCAAEKLQDLPQEQANVQGHHSRYYAAFLQQQQACLKSEEQKEALAEIGAEIDNVRTAWHWAIDQGQIEEIGQSLEGLSLYYDIRGWFQEGEEAFSRVVASLAREQGNEETGGQAALSAIRSLEPELILGNLLARQGWFCFRLARYEQAEELIQESLAIFSRLGARREMAYPFLFLGGVAYGSRQYPEAKQRFQESLAIYRESCDRWGMAGCLGNLGGVANALEEYQEAEQFGREGLAISREIGNQYQIAHCLNNLATTTYRLGKYAEAKLLFEESVTTAREIDYQYLVANSLMGLGQIAYLLAEYAEAKQHFQESLLIHKEIGDQQGVAVCLNHLGNVACALGDEAYPESKKYLHEALKMAWDIKVIPMSLQIMVGIATLMAKEGNREQALELLTFTLQHPRSDKETIDKASHLLIELKRQLPRKAVGAAQGRAKEKRLEEVVAEIMGLSAA